jgi:hypothetical protein
LDNSSCEGFPLGCCEEGSEVAIIYDAKHGKNLAEQSMQDQSSNNGKAAAIEAAVGDEESRPNAKTKRKKPLGRQVRLQVQGDSRGQVRQPPS